MTGDHAILEVMATHGGAFARAIAVAAFQADPDNYARLKAAFPELWTKYADIAALIAKRDAAKTGGA